MKGAGGGGSVQVGLNQVCVKLSFVFICYLIIRGIQVCLKWIRTRSYGRFLNCFVDAFLLLSLRIEQHKHCSVQVFENFSLHANLYTVVMLNKNITRNRHDKVVLSAVSA